MELRDRLLAAQDRRQGTVHVKEWDTDLRIMELSARQRMEMASWFADAGDDEAAVRWSIKAEQMALVVAWSVVDDSGDRVFSDDDAQALAEKSLPALQAIFTAITDLSSTPEEAEGN